MATPTEVIHGYRHLYRSLLQAVQYASPARHTARDQLRTAFRERGATWDATGVKRTLWFLRAAAKERGLEHKIVKNLLQVKGVRERERESFKLLVQHTKMKKPPKDMKPVAYQHYEMTIAMLNKSMGLLLR